MNVLDAILSRPVVCDAWRKLTTRNHRYIRTRLQLYFGPQGASQRILEIGCGVGFVAQMLPHHSYCGIDLSYSYLHYARRHYHGNFACMNAWNLGVKTRSQNGALVFAFFHHLDDQELGVFIREVKRVLVPGGRMLWMDAAKALSRGVSRGSSSGSTGDISSAPRSTTGLCLTCISGCWKNSGKTCGPGSFSVCSWKIISRAPGLKMDAGPRPNSRRVYDMSMRETLNTNEMPTTGQDLYYGVGQDHWWLTGKYEIICRLFHDYQTGGHRVLDVGCGPGNLMKQILPLTPGELMGIDLAWRGLKYALQSDFKNLVLGNMIQAPLKTASFDFVFAVDICEHVADDRELLAEIFRILKSRGRALIVVPAHPILWGEHDDRFGHFRRYYRKDFHSLLESAGFSILKLSYMQSYFFLPLLFCGRSKTCSNLTPRTFFPFRPGSINGCTGRWAQNIIFCGDILFLSGPI